MGRGRQLDAVGFDGYNQAVTGDVAKSLTAKRSDTDHTPVVCIPYNLKVRCGKEGGGKGALVQTDMSATLATNNDQYLFQPVSIENHPADSRVDIDESGKVQTLTSRMGTGGGNVPMVMEPVVFDGANVTSPVNASNPQPGDPCHTLSTDSRNILVNPVYCLQGNGIDRADTAGCNGAGWREGQRYTLNARDYKAPLSVAYLASGKDTVGTLMANAGTKLWLGNQEAFSSDYRIIEEKNIRYIVRRLTPTECARLQGFADRWAHPIWLDENTKGEVAEFWREVYLTDCAIKAKKPKPRIADKQNGWETATIRWYNGLHTDSSEYKLWGNGIALPCAMYVMQGISDVFNQERNMKAHDATEQAYKNGYEKGYEDGKRDAVKHGAWVEVDDGVLIGQGKHFECSECEMHATPWRLSNYCPFCGADMRGEEDGKQSSAD